MTTILSGRLPWFDSQFCLLLTWALLHFVWQGCLLALAFVLVRGALVGSSASVRYAAGMTILLLMAACLPMNLWLINPAPELPQSVQPEQVSHSGLALLPADDRDFDSAGSTGPSNSSPPTIAAIDAKIDNTQNFWNRAVDWTAAALTTVSTYAAAGYALGLAVMLTRVFVGLSIGRRLRRASTAVSDSATLDLARRHAARLALGTVPTIAWCSRVSVPVVVGVLRPMILLPISLATGLTGRQLEYVLLHELAHIHRYDPLANLLERLIESLLFFHPAVWWLTRQVSIERENACDDAVLRAGCQGPAYADALLRVAELCASGAGRGGAAAGLLAATGENPSQLTRRIMRLFGAEPPAHARSTTPAVAMLVLLSAFAILTLAAWRSPATAQVAASRSPAAQDEPTTPAEQKPVDAQPGEAQPANVQARVLHFPADRAMGIVSTRPASGDYATPVPERGFVHVWQPLGVARGDVQVPGGVDVRLVISLDASRDLSGLDQLAPEDIQFLELKHSHLDDDGLRQVGRLTGLRNLNLIPTAITDAGVEHLAGLKKLQVIRFDGLIERGHGSGIGDGALRVLAQMPDLRRATLRRMIKITDAGLAELASLKHLASLDIAGTSITDAGLASLKQLPALAHLHLGEFDQGTAITDAGLNNIGELTNLTHLDLSGSFLTDAGLAHLKKLSRLTTLTINFSGITQSGLAELEPLQSLEDLGLNRVPIDDAGAAALAKLKSLRKFTCDLRVTDKGLELLATLPMLEEMHLRGEGVTDAGIEQIARMKTLKALSFRGCPITDAGLAQLADLPQLERLSLWDTHVTGNGLACLATAARLSRLDTDIDGSRELKHAFDQIGNLTQLKGLHISGPVRSQDLKQLVGLTNLEFLAVSSPIDNYGALCLAKMRSLKSLTLSKSMITDSGLEELSRLGKLESLEIDGYFTDQGLSSLGELKSLKSLIIASPYVSQTAVDALVAELPALQFIWHSDNDPLQRERFRHGSPRGMEVKPAPSPAAGAANDAGAETASEPADRLDQQDAVRLRVVGSASQATRDIVNALGIEPGGRVKFVGNTITSGQRLKAQIESKPPILGLFKGQYNEEKANADIDKLIAYYRNLGFFRPDQPRGRHG